MYVYDYILTILGTPPAGSEWIAYATGSILFLLLVFGMLNFSRLIFK